ncbi:Rapid ALkalinization Factor [Dillenia turbinata]|uniref:Rapid ALkalinization Factor n=1 Tax=Dillenia turbinata TaxID=194707 RepID=A0AAN8UG48_9MAGN
MCQSTAFKSHRSPPATCDTRLEMVEEDVDILFLEKWECNGTIGECPIGEELEMLMDSEISRRQLGSTTHPTSNSLNPGQAVCGRDSSPKPNASCLPNKQANVNKGCNPYDE